MKLKRAWPAICIWVVFVLFDIVMVASCCFFSGLFPSGNTILDSGIFTVVSMLAVSILTVVLGKVSDNLMAHEFKDNVAFKILYAILAALILMGGVWYRLEILSNCTGDITGKYSLYENAMIGNSNPVQEYDLLSIVYSAILKVILIFTGNIITVPFIFQIACFTIFMICCFFTVKSLLGMSAAVVTAAYLAFVPVFTNAFTGLELSTDSLFMAMFGIELFVVSRYLMGAYKGLYTHKLWTIGFAFVGIVVGFMAYVDAGTIIMILPFFMAAPALYGRKPSKEALRLVYVLIFAVITFFVMIIQEAGIASFSVRLSNWASYYFHNLNTFSAFWAYTDHKMMYLLTVIGMSGVIVGFWKNQQVEKISPWLLSMLLIFATVPFMGATRMNTQVFVTVYYAFILGCVSSLITLPANEAGDYPPDEDLGWVDPEVREEVKKLAGEDEEEEEPLAAAADESRDIASDETLDESVEGSDDSDSVTAASEIDTVTEVQEEQQGEETKEDLDAVRAPETETPSEPIAAPDAEDYTETTVVSEPKEILDFKEVTESGTDSEYEKVSAVHTEKKQRFVPKDMVLPEDDDDVDLTPRMKMPPMRTGEDFGGKPEKLHINRPKEKTEKRLDERDAIIAAIKEINDSVPKYIDEIETADNTNKPQDAPQPVQSVDDFDLSLKPGDDFDI